jgi:GABA permease
VLRLPNRTLTSLESALLSVGGLIGAGLFVGSGTAILSVGPAIVASYVVAGMMLLALLHLIARMRRRMPAAIFITDYIYAGLGARVGAVAVRVYWIFWTLVVTIEALAGANILAPAGGARGFLVAVGLLVATIAVGERLASMLAELEVGLAGIKVAIIAAFIAFSAYHVLRGRVSPAAPVAGLDPRAAPSVLAGLATVFFSLAGAEIVHGAVSTPAATRRESTRAIGLMSVRVFGIYVTSVALIVAVIHSDVLRPGFSPFTSVLRQFDYPRAAGCLSAVILLGVLTTLNGALAVGCGIDRSALCRRDAAEHDLQAAGSRGIASRLVTGGLALAVLTAAAIRPAGAYRYLVTSAGILLVMVYLLFALASGKLQPPDGGDPGGVESRWMRRVLVAGLAAALLCIAWLREFQAALLGAVCAVIVAAAAEYALRLAMPRSA